MPIIKLSDTVYISGYTGPIFAIFLLYESALGADDESVPYFLICQGTLPWQPNNVRWNEKVMKADWYHVHSLHVHQVEARLCYYLLGDDTAAVYARLCHAFLVILAATTVSLFLVTFCELYAVWIEIYMRVVHTGHIAMKEQKSYHCT